MSQDPLISKRIENFKAIVTYGDIGSQGCLDQIRKKVTDKIFVQKRIGSSSVNGEAYWGGIYACPRYEGCSPSDISVKLIPIKPEEIPFAKDHRTNKEAYKHTLWAELLFMHLCSYVVKQAKIPNLPMTYAYMLCGRCQYQNPHLNNILPPNTPCLILLNEFARGGDFAMWLKKSRSISEWSMAYFQIFTALYFLQKFFNITHHDLHWGNVLVHPAPRGGYSAYKIDNNVYYIPNIGYTFVLWDFGYARRPGSVEIASLSRYYDEPEQVPRLLIDYFRIAQAPMWLLDPQVLDEMPEYIRVMVPNDLLTDFYQPLLKMYTNGDTLKTVIPKLWGIYTRKPENAIIIERYDLDSPFKNFPKEHAFLLHDFIKHPVPDNVYNPAPVADHNIKVYSKHGYSKMILDKKGEILLAKADRDYEYYDDPMDID